jgi:hypothetical protein
MCQNALQSKKGRRGRLEEVKTFAPLEIKCRIGRREDAGGSLSRARIVAFIPGIWEHPSAEEGSLGTSRTVAATGIPYQHCLLRNRVVAHTTTWINGMLIVETPADRVAFDNLIAHGGSEAAVRVGIGVADWYFTQKEQIE